MVTPELLEFIRKQHTDGIARADLEGLLISEGGWNKDDVKEAYDTILGNVTNSPEATPVTTPPPQITSVKTEPTPIVENKIEAIEPVALPAVDLSQNVAPVTENLIAEEEHVRRPMIEVIAKEAIAEEKLPVRDTPKSDEDFLGIFHGTEAVTETSVPTVEAPPVPPVIGKVLPVNAVPAPEPIEPKPIFVETPAPVLMEETPTPPPVLTPAPSIQVGATQFHPENIAPASVQGVITPPLAATSVKTPEQPAPFKLDLSKIRSIETKPITPVAAPVAVPPVSGDVKVKSPSIISAPQSWLKGMKHIETAEKPAEIKPVSIPEKKIETPPPSPIAIKPTVVLSEPIVETKEPQMEIPAPKQEPKKQSVASDLLLRGAGAAVVGMPAINPKEEEPLLKQITKKPSEKNLLQVAEESVLAEEIKKKNAVKRTLALSIGAFVFVIVVAIAIFVYVKYSGPSTIQTSAAAFSQFFNANSFSFKGKANTDLVLSTATNGIERTGIVRFDFDYGGLLQNGKEGYGDGVHRVKFSGELSSGNFAWRTDTPIEVDIRVIGSALYFRILSFPSSSDLDPELFKTYWVKVNLADIAKELELSGVSLSEEGYGSFGGQNSETTFNALLKKYTPFVVTDPLPDEIINGVETLHVKMKTDPEKMLMFVSSMYRKYFSKELLLTSDERIRFLDGLAKITGDVWIDKGTGGLVQIAFSGNFDDDMVGIHVKGPMNIFFGLADFNKQVSVSPPTPILTLEELKVRMEDYKKIIDARGRDKVKVDRMNTITDALEAYKRNKGRYPAALSELYAADVLTVETIDESKLKTYIYAAYQNSSSLSKVNRCTVSGKTCDFAHVGTSLEDQTNPILQNDTDIKSDVRGDDEFGCAGETDLACYDLTVGAGNQVSQ